MTLWNHKGIWYLQVQIYNLHVRRKVKMWWLRLIKLLLLLLLRRHDGCYGRQPQSLDQSRSMMLLLMMMCRVSSSRWCVLVPRLLASLGLLHLASGHGHVGIPHPLLVQLVLGPQQHPQADRQLTLGRLSMLSLQYCCIELTCNLTVD